MNRDEQSLIFHLLVESNKKSDALSERNERKTILPILPGDCFGEAWSNNREICWCHLPILNNPYIYIYKLYKSLLSFITWFPQNNKTTHLWDLFFLLFFQQINWSELNLMRFPEAFHFGWGGGVNYSQSKVTQCLRSPKYTPRSLTAIWFWKVIKAT